MVHIIPEMRKAYVRRMWVHTTKDATCQDSGKLPWEFVYDVH